MLEFQKRIFDKIANIEGNDFFFFVIMELLLPAWYLVIEVYSEPCETSKMDCFVKKLLTTESR